MPPAGGMPGMMPGMPGMPGMPPQVDPLWGYFSAVAGTVSSLIYILSHLTCIK